MMTTEQESTFEYTQEDFLLSADENLLDDNELIDHVVEGDREDEGEEGELTEILAGTSKVEKENRITPPYLTKYEKVRIIATRYMQISNNAPAMVDVQDETDPYAIVLLELREKKIPLIIRRHLPSGDFEDWELHELEILS